MLLAVFIFSVLAAAGIIAWLVVQGRKNAAHLRELSRRELSALSGEHDKYVKRLQRKISEANDVGHLDFAGDLLPVLDALDGALKAEAGATQDADDGLRTGLRLVAREMEAVLARHGIARCEPAPGAPFDPQRHEAVAVVDCAPAPPQPDSADDIQGDDIQGDDIQGDELPADKPALAPRVMAGHVVECLRPGFVHGERVLRSAAVSVAAQPKSAADHSK